MGGKGKRRTKSSGTNKIDKNCTATLKLVTHEDQSVRVFINHTNYGHTKQLQHITLSDRVRKGIASELHHGISKQNILDDIRDGAIGSKLQRIHLIEKKTLCNIDKSFNVNSIYRSRNDQESVVAWLAEWGGGGDRNTTQLCLKRCRVIHVVGLRMKIS